MRITAAQLAVVRDLVAATANVDAATIGELAILAEVPGGAVLCYSGCHAECVKDWMAAVADHPHLDLESESN